jgi:hypothetical protein
VNLATHTRDPERSTRVVVEVRGIPATCKTLRIWTTDRKRAERIARNHWAGVWMVAPDRVEANAVPTLRVVR